MEECVLRLSWEDIESELGGIDLSDEEKQKLFNATVSRMKGNEVIMDGFWTVIRNEIAEL